MCDKHNTEIKEDVITANDVIKFVRENYIIVDKYEKIFHELKEFAELGINLTSDIENLIKEYFQDNKYLTFN